MGAGFQQVPFAAAGHFRVGGAGLQTPLIMTQIAQDAGVARWTLKHGPTHRDLDLVDQVLGVVEACRIVREGLFENVVFKVLLKWAPHVG